MSGIDIIERIENCINKSDIYRNTLDGYVHGWFHLDNVSLADIEKAAAYFHVKPYWNDHTKEVVLQLSAGTGLKDVLFLHSQSFKEKEPF